MLYLNDKITKYLHKLILSKTQPLYLCNNSREFKQLHNQKQLDNKRMSQQCFKKRGQCGDLQSENVFIR